MNATLDSQVHAMRNLAPEKLHELNDAYNAYRKSARDKLHVQTTLEISRQIAHDHNLHTIARVLSHVSNVLGLSGDAPTYAPTYDELCVMREQFMEIVAKYTCDLTRVLTRLKLSSVNCLALSDAHELSATIARVALKKAACAEVLREYETLLHDVLQVHETMLAHAQDRIRLMDLRLKYSAARQLYLEISWKKRVFKDTPNTLAAVQKIEKDIDRATHEQLMEVKRLEETLAEFRALNDASPLMHVLNEYRRDRIIIERKLQLLDIHK